MPQENKAIQIRRASTDNVNVYAAGAWFDDVSARRASGDDGAATYTYDGAQELYDSIQEVGDFNVGGKSVGHAEYVEGLIIDGVSFYMKEHGGEAPRADLIAGAVSKAKNAIFDDITTGQSKSTSYIQNAIKVAIYSTFRDVIPFAFTAQVNDPKSKSQGFAIFRAVAGKSAGFYAKGQSISGGNAGKQFIRADRHILVESGEATLTSKTLAGDKCAPVDAATGVTLLPIKRGLSEILVNGVLAAREVSTSTTSTAASISGQIEIGGVQYTAAGTVNFAQSKVSIAFTPALPANTAVHARVVIDYENNPDSHPVFTPEVTDYRLYSIPSTGLAKMTEAGVSQIREELGIDPMGAVQMLMQSQYNLETYYGALRHGLRVGVANSSTHDFDWVGQKAQKNISDIMGNFQSVLALASQKMVLETQDHGVTHIYVDSLTFAPFLRSLPSSMFVPSGIPDSTNITFMGVLFGAYRVYSVSNLFAAGAAGTSKMLCVGCSEQANLNPYVVGDVRPPRFEPLGRDRDQATQFTFNVDGFAQGNPHPPAAKGFAVIDVVNLPVFA